MAKPALAKPVQRPSSAKAVATRPHRGAGALRALAVAHPFGPMQAKLTVGSAHDSFEAEADATAERVMRWPELTGTPTLAPISVQRACACAACAGGKGTSHQQPSPDLSSVEETVRTKS